MKKKETILVTGGAGYIGANILFYLLKNNIDFVVCDNFSNCTDYSIKQLEKHFNRKIKVYNADICDRDALKQIFEENNITKVLHLAGKKYIGESFKMPEYYYQNNVEATKNILNVMNEFGVSKMYFASSIATYGSPKYLPLDTKMPLEPISPYGQNKKECEEIISAWQNQSPNRLAVLFRFTNPIGSRVNPNLGDLSTSEYQNLVPYLTSTISKNKPISINGNDHPTADGTVERDYIDVKDLSRAICDVMNLERNSGKYTYVVGRGKTYSVLQILKTLFSIYGKELKYGVNPKRDGDVPTITADITPLINDINFKPHYSLYQTLLAQKKYTEQINVGLQLSK